MRYLSWVGGAVVCLACFIAAYLHVDNTVMTSETALNMFAVQQAEESINATDVALKAHSSFAGVGCMSAETHQELWEGVELYLADVPDAIRTNILERALPQKSGEHSATIETSNLKDGQTTYVLAFWHTRVSEDKAETCLSVAGAIVEAADRMVGTTVKKTQITVGYVPCDCTFRGYFCSTCPLLEETEEHVPLTVPVRWSERQHREMRLALKVHSVRQIKDLTRTPLPLESLPPAELHGAESTLLD